jgi:hypothetical protein
MIDESAIGNLTLDGDETSATDRVFPDQPGF